MQVLEDIAASSAPVTLLCAPTGSGKSILGMAAAKILNAKRTVILCRTIGLQQQYLESFPDVPLLTGKRNHICLLPGIPAGTMADTAPCNAGFDCELKRGGCLYYDHIRKAASSPVTIANYKVWLLTVNMETESSRYFDNLDLLVADEGHSLVLGEGIDDIASIELWPQKLTRLNLGPLIYQPRVSYYRNWATDRYKVAKRAYQAVLEQWQGEIATASFTGQQVEELRDLKHLAFALERLAEMENPEDWIVDGPGHTKPGDEVTRWRVKLAPVLGGDRRKLIYNHAKKIIIMSATLLPTDDTARFLGLREGEYSIHSVASSFPIENRPIYIWPVGKLTFQTTDTLLPALIARIDEIATGNLPERGLIHTTNFRVTEAIMAGSKYADQMVTHSFKNRTALIQAWLDGKTPPILVSPSLHEGLDGYDDRLRWQVIAKVPFKDLQDPLWAARLKIDQRLYDYAAVSGIVQAAGRSVRHDKDRGICYILDGKFNDLWDRHREFFPPWFQEAVQWV